MTAYVGPEGLVDILDLVNPDNPGSFMLGVWMAWTSTFPVVGSPELWINSRPQHSSRRC